LIRLDICIKRSTMDGMKMKKLGFATLIASRLVASVLGLAATNGFVDLPFR